MASAWSDASSTIKRRPASRLFIDESALARLDDLAVGDNTRLFLANTDGPSWPIRQAANGATEVGVAKGRWLKLGAHLADVSLGLALRISSLPLDGTETRAVIDPGRLKQRDAES